MKTSLTVVVPALNEEENLSNTINKILNSVPKYFKNTEILIYNDGSSDQTGAIADGLKEQNKSIDVIHHTHSRNVGYIFKDALNRSQADYIVMIHGQDDIYPTSLNLLFSQNVDIVIPYQVNTFERPLYRAIASRIFVNILNLLFGLDIRYYNHYVLFKRELIEDFNEMTTSYAFQAEILIKILKKRSPSYLEIPFEDDFSNKRKSNALSMKNIIGVAKFFIRITYDVYFKK